MKTLKKKPIQIYIEPKQELLLESLARRRGTSKSEIIRLSINKYLNNLPLEEDPTLGIIGLGRSGRGDLSGQHDAYLTKHLAGRTTKKRG